jgi:hypothetical protein
MAAAIAGTRQQMRSRHPCLPQRARCARLGGLQDELNSLSKMGKWVDMGNLITDEISTSPSSANETIAPSCTAATAMSSSGSASTRYKSDPERWATVLEALKSA